MAPRPPTPDPRGRCGSRAGYAAHRRRGESACPECKSANAAKARQQYHQAKTAPPKPKKQAAPAVQESAPLRQPEPEPLPRVNAPAEDHTDVDSTLPEPPEYLKAKGRGLWNDLTRRYKFTDGALVLLGEACRTTDRLERMAAALSSRSTLWFEVGDIDLAEDAGVPVVVNGMIGEARQLQTSLRQTLTQLGVVGVEAANVEGHKSALDQLAERRAARLAAAGGE